MDNTVICAQRSIYSLALVLYVQNLCCNLLSVYKVMKCGHLFDTLKEQMGHIIAVVVREGSNTTQHRTRHETRHNTKRRKDESTETVEVIEVGDTDRSLR